MLTICHSAALQYGLLYSIHFVLKYLIGLSYIIHNYTTGDFPLFMLAYVLNMAIVNWLIPHTSMLLVYGFQRMVRHT